MSRYILNEGYALRGWKGLPFALRYPDPHKTEFFDKESYRVVYALDGTHDIDEAALSKRQRSLLRYLIEHDVAVPAEHGERLEPWQEYKTFPGMYKSSVQWSITGRCNYNCRHCFMSAPDYKGEDLSMEQCVHILDELAANGIGVISLTGGEPLVSPHFYGILDEIAKRGMLVDVLYSNGALVNDTLLDELERRNMHPNFHISFDGVGWHDWLRGEEGAEEEALRAFKLLHARGFQTTSSMCLHRHNIGTLRETVNLLASLGLVHLKMNVASPTGRWKNETEHFITQDEANQAILDYIPQYIEDGMPLSVQFCGLLDFDKEHRRIQIPSRKYSGIAGAEKQLACGAVRDSMYISPNGRILPCMTMGGTAADPLFDSIFEKSLEEILSESYYRDTCLLKMGACIEHNEKCRDCQYRLACGAGCRACACGETGTDYLGIDEETCHFFLSGWYDKANEAVKQYRDSFPPEGNDEHNHFSSTR